jgi:hypothetical protein
VEAAVGGVDEVHGVGVKLVASMGGGGWSVTAVGCSCGGSPRRLGGGETTSVVWYGGHW